ncbi:glycogen/starch synthase, partial [Aquisphaera insulae]|uniref:glycogen/starch synthase n=1 Tax=Aquisphaera insulae TaxID=2712864 RepID=UPI0013E9D074
MATPTLHPLAAMAGASPGPAPLDVPEALRHGRMILLRWETEHTPCTGITAVTRQERRAFATLGTMIAPWQPRMAAAAAAEARGLVAPTGEEFTLAGPCAPGARVRVLATTTTPAASPSAAAVMPIVYLDVDGAFRGELNPYDTPDLARDALVFGAAVGEFLDRAGASPRQFAWGADWQTVPALVLLRGRHHTVLTLHNEFDAWLAPEARVHGGGLYAPFRGPETALRVGLRQADVVTTVNRGYARGLRTEPIHTQVMARHLQDLAWRIVPVENANFHALKPALLELEQLLARDPGAGLRALELSRLEARGMLPEPLRSRAGEKVLVVAMGRRVAQKLHEVVAEGVRRLLRDRRGLPVFVVLATVAGESAAADAARLARLEELEAEFPDQVEVTDGRLDYYDTLLRAADYNAMTSLYEPHGGAFEGAVVPIVRMVDGLARQVNPFEPSGRAARLAAAWHDPWDDPSGLGFREPAAATEVSDLSALLTGQVGDDNATFRGMVDAFAETLGAAVDLRRDRPRDYALLVRGALRAQRSRDWMIHLGGILALVEEARLRRPI